MRVIALAALACALVLAATQAPAQTYDPSYPFCKKVSGDPTYFDCRFTSMAECQQDIRGMSAECLANPYFRGSREGAPRSSTDR